MIYDMHLEPVYFDYIKNGTKRIELRLLDEKRSKIVVGDIIRFYREPKRIEYFDVKVVELLRYNSFDELFKDYPIELLADKSMTKDELKDVLEKFYTTEEQQKYGVLGIEFEIINK